MPNFAYRTISAAGQRTRGHARGTDATAVVRALEARGLTVLRVEERSEDSRRFWRPPRLAVTDAVHAIAALLPTGIPIARAFDLASRTAPRAVADLLRDLHARVERGESVAAAMMAHPEAFAPTSVGIVHAGERAGDLDGAFARLAAQLERADALRARLLSAAIYPAVLAVAGGSALLVLLLFVLPRFAALLAGTGMPIPRSTAVLLSIAAMLRANWMTLPLMAAGVLALIVWLRESADGRRTWSQLLLALPMIGAFRRDVLGAENARTLGVLLAGGAPIAAALDDAARSADDVSLRAALERARARVVSGSTLHAAFAAESVFNDVYVSLVATGEDAGRVPEFLHRAAEFLERRIERNAQRLVALAEPAMIVVFGAIIGSVALSLLQAIYGMNPAALR